MSKRSETSCGSGTHANRNDFLSRSVAVNTDEVISTPEDGGVHPAAKTLIYTNPIGPYPLMNGIKPMAFDILSKDDLVAQRESLGAYLTKLTELQRWMSACASGLDVLLKLIRRVENAVHLRATTLRPPSAENGTPSPTELYHRYAHLILAKFYFDVAQYLDVEHDDLADELEPDETNEDVEQDESSENVENEENDDEIENLVHSDLNEAWKYQQRQQNQSQSSQSPQDKHQHLAARNLYSAVNLEVADDVRATRRSILAPLQDVATAAATRIMQACDRINPAIRHGTESSEVANNSSTASSELEIKERIKEYLSILRAVPSPTIACSRGPAAKIRRGIKGLICMIISEPVTLISVAFKLNQDPVDSMDGTQLPPPPAEVGYLVDFVHESWPFLRRFGLAENEALLLKQLQPQMDNDNSGSDVASSSRQNNIINARIAARRINGSSTNAESSLVKNRVSITDTETSSRAHRSSETAQTSASSVDLLHAPASALLDRLLDSISAIVNECAQAEAYEVYQLIKELRRHEDAALRTGVQTRMALSAECVKLCRRYEDGDEAIRALLSDIVMKLHVAVNDVNERFREHCPCRRLLHVVKETSNLPPSAARSEHRE